ncbi:unnamed protein product [Caenorhabditis auriculariae]|uniref:glutathione transferase n=1 Tax=Caenorhabditis auriculariae TaxID=2777116 RepID=A0A8S1HJ46_9PELO|nr:unnamed protein product [Caenorhabditis auriculariae]
MVQYKLTYFDLRGLAETARQLFALAGVDYEDVRVDFDTWPEIKPKTFFGKLPILEVDGKQIPQSLAISRFLANKFGYAGKSDMEKAWADAFADQFKDFLMSIGPYFAAKRLGKPQSEIDSILKETVRPAYDDLFKVVTKRLQKSSTGFLLDCGLTYPDLTLAELTFYAQKMGVIDSNYTEVLEHLKKVQSVPQIKKWIEKRPVTEH